jgi:hypothetical protein
MALSPSGPASPESLQREQSLEIEQLRHTLAALRRQLELQEQQAALRLAEALADEREANRQLRLTIEQLRLALEDQHRQAGEQLSQRDRDHRLEREQLQATIAVLRQRLESGRSTAADGEPG